MGFGHRQAYARRSTGPGKAVIAIFGPLQPVRDAAPGVQETQAGIAHQPFIGCGRREIDAAAVQIDRNGAGRMDDIGIDQRAHLVSHVAYGLQIMAETVIGRYQ